MFIYIYSDIDIQCIFINKKIAYRYGLIDTLKYIKINIYIYTFLGGLPMICLFNLFSFTLLFMFFMELV